MFLSVKIIRSSLLAFTRQRELYPFNALSQCYVSSVSSSKTDQWDILTVLKAHKISRRSIKLRTLCNLDWISALKICRKSESCSVMSDSLQPHGLYSPWNSLGQNTWVGSLYLLQGIFPTQGSNPGLLSCRQILYQLSHKGSPKICQRIELKSSQHLVDGRSS